MAKRLQEYVKYTLKELESYTKQEGSCVRKVNSNLHMSLGPYCLADFKHALRAHLMRRKVGYYDPSLEGIVLDIKNIKVLGGSAALRADDPRLHVNVNADCYVFQPVAGAILSGVVKHVGNHHIGVIIYRVFNVSIRFGGKINKEEIDMDDNVQFRIKNFNLQNVFPYIEGDLVTANGEPILTKFIKVEPESTVDGNHDSGIEERENQDLKDLVSLIKKEYGSEDDAVSLKGVSNKKAKSKRKGKASFSETSSSSFNETTVIKIEPGSAEKKKSKNDEEGVAGKIKKKKTTNIEVVDNLQIKKEEEIEDGPVKNRKRKRGSIANGTS